MIKCISASLKFRVSAGFGKHIAGVAESVEYKSYVDLMTNNLIP